MSKKNLEDLSVGREEHDKRVGKANISIQNIRKLVENSDLNTSLILSELKNLQLLIDSLPERKRRNFLDLTIQIFQGAKIIGSSISLTSELMGKIMGN